MNFSANPSERSNVQSRQNFCQLRLSSLDFRTPNFICAESEGGRKNETKINTKQGQSQKEIK